MRFCFRCSLFKFMVVFSPIWLIFLIVINMNTRKIVNERLLQPKATAYNVVDKMYAEMGFKSDEVKFYGLKDVKKLFPLKQLQQMKIQMDKQANSEIGDVFLKKKNGKVLVKQGKGRRREKISSLPNIFKDLNLGEFGKAVIMPESLPPDIQDIVDEGWKQNAFNQYLSDLISVRRKLPDCQGDYCKVVSGSYSKNLPATSVIFIFHDEAWSTLLRSVHSVLDNSPEKLITEVILVDDASTMDHLKQPLDDYFLDYPKVKILRATEREGLIRARLRGAAIAKGPVLTFLDSHIECTTGWLEPLLDRIAKNPMSVACPIINIIDDKTFEFKCHTSLSPLLVGGFNWRLSFYWISAAHRETMDRKSHWDPVKSPTMAGGLYSIDKKFFEKLGGYDPGFDIWGAENLEISFKTWMCGGTLEIIPCSQVGHIFRDKSPYSWKKGVNVFARNSKRLAEVWMDEYAKFFYDRSGRKADGFGDISNRLKLRKELNCKPFKWYLNTIYPEQYDPSTAVAFGGIRSFAFNKKSCLSGRLTDVQPSVLVKTCFMHHDDQFFWYTTNNQIRRDRICLDFSKSLNLLSMVPCKEKRKSQKWNFKNDTNQLIHPKSSLCLSADQHTATLSLQNCKSEELQQKWLFDNRQTSKYKG